MCERLGCSHGIALLVCLVVAPPVFGEQGDPDQSLDVVGAPIPGSDTSTLSNPGDVGYGKPNQSRLWFNQAAGRWDAVVPKNDGGDSGSNHYILTDAVGAPTFGALQLENRNSARPDVFWDDARCWLYVLGSHGEQTRLWRLHYSLMTDAYELDPQVDGVLVPGIRHASENRPSRC